MSIEDNLTATPAVAPDAAALTLPLNVEQIQALLPHRFPFLLLDRILEFEPRKRIVALKNVTANEPFFQGHFPGRPVMPGVLIIEALAQAGALMILQAQPERDSKLVLFTGIEHARFRRPVVPGDQLRLEVTVTAFRSIAGKMDGVAYVDGKLVAEAKLSCAVVNR